MGKKKGKGKRRRYSQKKKKGGGGRSKHPIRVAATVGVAKTVYDAETAPSGARSLAATQWANLKAPTAAGLRYAANETVRVYKTKAGPAMLGLAISYGDKLPLIGKPYQKLVGRHLDKLARAVFGKGVKK